jgi:hypothetical protein
MQAELGKRGMDDRKDVSIYETDTDADRARKLTEALNWVHERRGPVMIWYRGGQYAMIVLPDGSPAWDPSEVPRIHAGRPDR